MNEAEIKSRMAVFSFNGKTYDCGFGLYDYRHDHTDRTCKAASKWCETRNRELSK